MPPRLHKRRDGWKKRRHKAKKRRQNACRKSAEIEGARPVRDTRNPVLYPDTKIRTITMKNPFNASATSGKSAYAPCYSASERLRLFAVTVFCLIGVGTVLHHTFFPWLHAIRPCDTVFGLPGINIIIFTPFAGLPLLLLLCGLRLDRRGAWTLFAVLAAELAAEEQPTDATASAARMVAEDIVG